jgi:hypothetical protein
LVTALTPGVLVVGFVETARIWPGELRKNIAFTLMAGVLFSVGWLNANERWRAWATRLLAFAVACAAWDVFLARAVYPGLMWRPSRACSARMWSWWESPSVWLGWYEGLHARHLGC